MLTVAISQEPLDYDEHGHDGEYFVTVNCDGKRYKKYYTYLPEFEDVKSDFEIFKEDFELIEN